MAKRIGANQRLKMQQKKQKVSSVKRKAVKKGWKFLLVILLIVGVAFGSYRVYGLGSDYLKSSKIFKVDKVVVRGVINIDTLKVLKIVELEKIDSTISLKTSSIENRLKQSGYFKSVKVKRKYPSTFEIIVEEREAVAFVNLGEIFMMDSEGALWPIRVSSYNSLPIFSGLKDTVIEKSKMLTDKSKRKVKQFFTELDKTEKLRLDAVSQVEFGDDNIIKIHLESSSVVAIINSYEIKDDLVKLWNIMESLANVKPIPNQIDLSCGKLAFVR